MTENKSEASRYIPSEIRRQVLLEAGHACAIPTCQFPATEFAHIEPFSKVKKHEASNIIALCPNHHALYDQKGAIDRKSMRAYKQKLQFLNSRYTKYELRLLAALSKKRLVLAMGEIQCQGLLQDGLIENAKELMANDLKITNNDTGEVVFEDHAIAFFAAKLTEKGSAFIQSWQDNEEDLTNAI